MKITNIAKLILFVFIHTLHVSGFAQIQEKNSGNLPYLKELEKMLFPPDEPKINGKYHPNCIEDDGSRYYRTWEELDTIIMVRANQPDKDRICNLLQKIATTKNYVYFQPLMEMYKRHQAYFEEEWLFLRSWYHGVCQKAKNDPVIIMNGFEHALFALELAQLNASQSDLIYAFDYYIRSWHEESYLNSNKKKGKESLNNEKKTIMYYHYDYLKKDRTAGHIWWPHRAGFGFYSFFMDELEDHIVDKIMALDVNNFGQLSSENFEAYFKSQEFQFILRAMSNIRSRKFERALESIFDEFVKTGYIVRVFEYTQSNTEVSPQFIRFLLDKIYTHEHFKDDLEIQEHFTGILGFMLNTHTSPVIKEYLMERTEAINQEDRLRTWSYLVYFTNEPEVLQLMLDKSNQKNISPEESQILANNFKRMLKAKDFPEEYRNTVEQQYKKMRYETRQK